MSISSIVVLLLPLVLLLLIGIVFVIVLITSVKIVPESKRLSVFRLGQYLAEKGPGIVFLVPFIDKAITSEPGNPIKNI